MLSYCYACVSLQFASPAAHFSLSLAGEASSASHTGTTGTQAQQGINETCKAVKMAISLLDMHPLSPRPPPQAPSLLLLKDCSQTMSADNTDQQCASTQPEQWPTPKSTEWADIVLVTERACSALEQALLIRLTSPDSIHELILQLCQLLKCLVIGHLPDMGLDMYKLFQDGLQPVLKAQVVGIVEYTDLAVAVLSRLAADCNLLPAEGRRLAGPQIISVFCEFLQAEPVAVMSSRPVS